MTRLFAGTQWDMPPRCERCGELEENCHCPPPPKTYLAPEKQTAKVAVENRKAGKKVTVVRGLSAEDSNLPELLTELKSTCGAGGTIRDNNIELQGDQATQVKSILSSKGYKVK